MEDKNESIEKNNIEVEKKEKNNDNLSDTKSSNESDDKNNQNIENENLATSNRKARPLYIKRKSIINVSFAEKFNEIETSKENTNKVLLIDPKLPVLTEQEVLKIEKKHNKDLEDKELIENVILKHFFIRNLEKQARLEIVKEMSLAKVKKDNIVFRQGSAGNYFYILKKGTCVLIIDNEIKNTFNVGDSFGELALLYESSRKGSLKTTTDCSFWILERKNFKKIIDHINKQNFEENKTFIQSIPILSNLDHEQTAILSTSLLKETFDEQQIIVKEGDIAECLYIVKEGEVNCIRNGNIIRTLKHGDNFGERAILVESKRSLDVVAKTKCICYSLTKAVLKNMLGDEYIKFLYFNFLMGSFYKSKYFNKINKNIVMDIFDLFETKNIGSDTIAFNKGYEKNSNIVIIIDGQLINAETKEKIGERGSVLFEEEIFKNLNEKIDYDLVPFPDCLYLIADIKKIVERLGYNIEEMIEKSEIITTLHLVRIFRNLPIKKLKNIADKIGTQQFKKDDKIIIEGEPGDKFYIVKKGQVDISVKNKYIRTLNEKEYFGERALFFNENRNATIIAKEDVETYYLKQNDFLDNIEENMKKFLINRMYLQDNLLELKDLVIIRQLGSGNYGNVAKVKSLRNNCYYALKGISRKQIDHENLHKSLELERSILLQIDHPFIVKLLKTLKDKRFIYFIMENIQGKELFDVIREIGLLNKNQCQFYAGNMLLAIEYLHERNFVYRDIKPENVMVEYESGYLKIIDFGTAKKIIDRTTTIIGTPNYMAPEVILGEGYSFQVDVWSIAVCMYEFMCGGLPFGDKAEDPMEVYQSIITGKLSFPSFLKDKDFIKLMRHMLTKSLSNRLTKINLIKNHVWFKNFDWDELITMNMKPPYIIKQENKEEKPCENCGMSFPEYADKFYKEYDDSEDEPITEYKQKEFNKWFDNY
jgi:cGMP-dependent protein kinase